MTSQDYIVAYGMKKVSDGVDHYYKRQLEKNGNLITLTLHKMELINECYFVKQVYYRHRFNPKTNTYGILGNPQMTFGIKNTSFKTISKGEEEYGL